MARISTYGKEASSEIKGNDLLIGTDGGNENAGSAGATKNFLLSDLREFFTGGSTGGISEGVIPVEQGGGFVNSVISQNEDNQITINGDLVVNGTIGNVVSASEELTNLITSTNPNEDDDLSLFRTHVFYSTSSTLMAVLPSEPENGSWVKISKINGTPIVLFAGAVAAGDAGAGDRFMAGVEANGSPATNPHRLEIPGDINISFQLTYIDTEEDAPDGSPVGWVIVGA